MRTRVGVVAALSALAVWYVVGVSAVFGQSPPERPAATASATSAPSAAPAAAPGAEEDDEDIPRDLRDRLTGQQIYELLQAKNRGHEPPAVAIVVPVALFLMIFAIVAVGHYAVFRKDRQRHETLRLMVERGAEIPPELLGPRPTRHADLRRGIVLMAGGIGLAIVLASIVHERGVWTAGLIPTLLGLGYLLVWKLDRSNPEPGAPRVAEAKSSIT